MCIVNCPHGYASDVGSMLCENKNVDFAVLWRYNHPTGEYYVSLRSKNVDMIEIAKRFDQNGGGHKNAAGFTCNVAPMILFCGF